MKTLLILIVLQMLSLVCFSQEAVKEITTDKECSYYGETLPDKIYTFGSEKEAEAAVDKIIKPLGLVRRFVIRSSDVPNAAAVIRGEDRFLLYNEEFMERIRRTEPDWAALSVMAHEVGHHLNGHTLIPGGSRPGIELEADKFSGFVLASMGATLEKAQAAMKALASENGSETHPPKQSRLLAIRAGWREWHEANPTSARILNRPETQLINITTGNTATLLSQNWWQWTVFISGSEDSLNQIKCVEYTLHPTFTPSIVSVCERGTGKPFGLIREGWGTFPIGVRVFLRNNQIQEFTHDLKF
jgi:hypothetical protein